jgi:hypothetical protein
MEVHVMSEIADRDPLKELWQHQVAAGRPALEELKRRAERSGRRLRRGSAVRITAAVLAVVFNAAAVMLMGTPYMGLLSAMAIAMLTIQLMDLPRAAVVNKIRNRPLTLGLTPEPPSCFDAYQLELEEQLKYVRPLRQQAVVAGMFGLIIAVVGSRRTAIAAPLGIVQTAAAAVWYFRAGQAAPRLQMELDELLAFRNQKG